LTVTVGVLTHVGKVWRLEDRVGWRYWTMKKVDPDKPPVRDELKEIRFRDLPREFATVQGLPLSSEGTGLAMAKFYLLTAVLADEKKLEDRAFLSFSRGVVFMMYLGFVLPLFTLAYASGGIGAEREGRTLIWLFTRPLPRWAVYLARFLGVLPWCLLASVGGFVVLCLVGGEYGRRALTIYWPTAVAGTIAFSALFFLVGALFRRPAVVGLVYVFFYELLVNNLPGSLKLLSLGYYTRSLFYNEAALAAPSATPDVLDVYAPTDPVTAWAALLAATVGLTLLGMYLFGRQEPREEI
jgi:ABC-type transport system involved in multi-copper enzyme maturation permease subunit